jgi:hypothetical protein
MPGGLQSFYFNPNNSTAADATIGIVYVAAIIATRVA